MSEIRTRTQLNNDKINNPGGPIHPKIKIEIPGPSVTYSGLGTGKPARQYIQMITRRKLEISLR